jgi:hypothetical protein
MWVESKLKNDFRCDFRDGRLPFLEYKQWLPLMAVLACLF